MKKIAHNFGFSLVELLITIAVIGILASIVYANFGSSRSIARDDMRKADLKNLQLAINLYKAQNGRYPEQGCGTVGSQWAGHAPVPNPPAAWGATCANYILGLTPDFIATLPIDAKFTTTNGVGYYYRTNAAGTEFKLIANGSVETKKITSYTEEFARCPQQGGQCPNATPPNGIYAVYSPGAATW